MRVVSNLYCADKLGNFFGGFYFGGSCGILAGSNRSVDLGHSQRLKFKSHQQEMMIPDLLVLVIMKKL